MIENTHLSLSGNSGVSRREMLRLGMVGLGGLSLGNLLRLRSSAAEPSHDQNTALIIVFLHGGASHLETYDPKPRAPSEYRGPFQPVHTAVPGMHLCELLPNHARIANKFSLLRSMVHTGFCHGIGQQQMFTGHDIREFKPKSDHPEFMAITNHVRHSHAFSPPQKQIASSDRKFLIGKSITGSSLPGYVGIPPIPYLGAAYLGPASEPFKIFGDPNAPNFKIPDTRIADQEKVDRLNRQRTLRNRLDRMQRDLDLHKNMQAMDWFEQSAWNMLTDPNAQRAFDISQEDVRTRDRYGRTRWGQQCLLARRLVEHGVDLVTTTLAGPEAGPVQNWDDHAVNHHVFDVMKKRAANFDRAVTALIEDIYDRGLDKRVMVLVTGEFGRTPKISYATGSISKVRQPGRDHWPRATSMLFAGGGITPGQVIGATDIRGEDVVARRIGPVDFLATMYRHLGVDPSRVEFTDFSGRPIPVLNAGSPIQELLPV